MPTLTHEARALRRRQIAEFASMKGIDMAAKEFSVHEATVRVALKAHGLNVPVRHQQGPAAVSSFRILWELLDGRAPTDLAAEYQVTKQWVSKVKKLAKNAGFEFPAD